MCSIYHCIQDTNVDLRQTETLFGARFERYLRG